MPVAAALPYVTAAASVAGVATSISAQRKAQSAAKDALAQQQQIAANLRYEPIDINNLKEQARQQAIQNATQSLALERDLTPDIAAARELTAQKVRSELALGGQLSPDVANQVARAARTAGALSGAPAGPLTAAQIGLTAQGLEQQRLGQAQNFLAQNKLPVAGLDPGTLASLIVSQNAAMNQFNAAKAGVNANLVQSAANVGAGQAASGQAISSTLLNQVPNVLGQISKLPIFQSPTGIGAATLSSPTITPNMFQTGGLTYGSTAPTSAFPSSGNLFAMPLNPYTAPGGGT